jgi:hypothetical protein
MGLKIICSGYLVRYPLGGKSWHELQYLLGLKRLGHDVTYCEHFGWPDSCYDPASEVMTGNPRYGISFLRGLLQRYGFDDHWCYIAEDNTTYGATQKHGLGGLHTRYHVLFTYGHNVHQQFSSMPAGGMRWLPPRPPVVLEQWSVEAATASAPFSTVMNWSPIGDQIFEGQVYGMKEREFEPFYSLPSESKQMMEIAVKVPETVRDRLTAGGWQIADPVYVTRSPFSYQIYLKSSRAEFSVAKHGYVAASCGWFSERSAAYLASGRPVVVQDTGFYHWLPTGSGINPLKNHDEALDGT